MSNEIEISLVETIRSSDLYDLTFDVADSVTSQIPIFGSLSKLWGSVHSIHAYFYSKKVLCFLRELDSMPRSEREAQLDKMLSTPGEQEKFGEHLALFLDRMNDVGKATMMGRAAAAFLQGKISVDDLKSINFALDAIDLRMIKSLKNASDIWHETPSHDALMLAQCGLMTPHLDIQTTPLNLSVMEIDGPEKSYRYQTFKSANLRYEVNHLGRLFMEICLP